MSHNQSKENSEICLQDVKSKEDIFANPEQIKKSLGNEIWKIYKELDIPLCYSTCRPLDKPLTLVAPTEEKLDKLKKAIPISFHVFCSFKVENIGIFRLE